LAMAPDVRLSFAVFACLFLRAAWALTVRERAGAPMPKPMLAALHSTSVFALGGGAANSSALGGNLSSSAPVGDWVCVGAADIVIIVDASGSVGAEGMKGTKAFLKRLAGHLRLGTAPSEQLVGVIQVGATAKVVSPLTRDRKELDAGIEALTPGGFGMDLAQGLGLVEAVARYGRESAPTKVLIIADGPPVRQRIALQFAARVAAYAQLIVLLVAPVHNERAIAAASEWATAGGPHTGTLLRSESYEHLGQSCPMSILASLCPLFGQVHRPMALN